MGFPERQRTFLVATCCLSAALAVNFGLIGLIVAIVLGIAAYNAARQSGPVWAAISDPATLRLASLVLAGLTVLGGIAFSLVHFTESIAPLVELAWVAAYLLTALHMLSPGSAAGLPASLDVAHSYRYLAVMTALSGFLIGGLSPIFVAWVLGFVYIVRAGEGLFGPFSPGKLWTAGANRLASIGILVAGGAMGLAWQEQSIYMPYYDYYTGWVNSYLENYTVGGHAQGIDLIPALLLTALLVWLAASPAERSTGARRWLPYLLVAVLAVYGVLFSFGGDFGPVLFILGVLAAGYGIYRKEGAPGAGSSISG